MSDRLDEVKKSSGFYGGSPTGFAFDIDGYKFPGRHDPLKYLEDFVIKGKVLIVHPGNGGLLFSIVRNHDVSYFEQRSAYRFTIDKLIAITGMPCKAVTASTLEKYDTILWSEGFEELKDPLDLLNSVIASLNPGGHFYFEVTHGEQTTLTGNSVRPKEEDFAVFLRSKGLKFSTAPGRYERRIIYDISLPDAKNSEGPFIMEDVRVKEKRKSKKVS